MSVDATKLEGILRELTMDVGYACSSSSVWIGEFNGKPVQVSVMSHAEASDNDYGGINSRWQCIDVPPPQNEAEQG